MPSQYLLKKTYVGWLKIMPLHFLWNTKWHYMTVIVLITAIIIILLTNFRNSYGEIWPYLLKKTHLLTFCMSWPNMRSIKMMEYTIHFTILQNFVQKMYTPDVVSELIMQQFAVLALTSYWRTMSDIHYSIHTCTSQLIISLHYNK